MTHPSDLPAEQLSGSASSHVGEQTPASSERGTDDPGTPAIGAHRAVPGNEDRRNAGLDDLDDGVQRDALGAEDHSRRLVVEDGDGRCPRPWSSDLATLARLAKRNASGTPAACPGVTEAIVSLVLPESAARLHAALVVAFWTAHVACCACALAHGLREESDGLECGRCGAPVRARRAAA